MQGDLQRRCVGNESALGGTEHHVVKSGPHDERHLVIHAVADDALLKISGNIAQENHLCFVKLYKDVIDGCRRGVDVNRADDIEMVGGVTELQLLCRSCSRQ